MKKVITSVFVASLLAISAPAHSEAITTILSIAQYVIKNTKQVTYVRVKSVAPTEAEARKEAFAKAIDKAAGTVILSEREVSGNKVVRNDIIGYASGTVDDFNIVETRQVNGQVEMTVEVWVNVNNIANRLQAMGASDGANVNGKAITKDYQREQTESKRVSDAKSMMTAVLGDYPRMAYDVETTKNYVARNTDSGQLNFYMKMNVKVRPTYAAALGTVISTTRDTEYPGYKGTTGLSIGVPRAVDNVLGTVSGGWKDPEMVNMAIEKFRGQTSMEITFVGAQSKKGCFPVNMLGKFVGQSYTRSGQRDDSTVVIKSDEVMPLFLAYSPTTAKMAEPEFMDWVATLQRVEARIMPADKCGK